MIILNENWLLCAEEICFHCGGDCCNEAHPPISSSCYTRLTKAGVSPESFENVGYRRLKTRENGECVLSTGGKCTIHAIKPETCRAGPFTFDVKGDVIEIFLKEPKICPIVSLLREVPEAYQQQYERALENISRLVSNLSDDEIAVICKIDEPDTVKVAEIPRIRKSG